MSKKLKKRLIRIIITASLYLPILIADKIINLSTVIPNTDLGWLLPLSIYVVIYLIIAYDILIKAGKNIIRGQVFDENFLMIVATFGAFVIMEFPEAVAVMLFYQVGEFFQDLAVGKSRQSIAELMDIRPDFANLIHENGEIEVTDPELVEVGQIIRVEPGEKIPLDGTIIRGSTSIDARALTGESLPVDVVEGSDVISGTINLSSSIDIEVKKAYQDSAVNKILELVENSTNVKSKQENFITKFAKWYTPIVVISAVLLILIGSLVTKDWMNWVSRGLNFLVVSCPCAIVISVPLSFFTSIGKAAKIGILIKGSMYLENFNRAKTFVFDKTGTLTKGNFAVSEVIPKYRREEILKYAAICEGQSNHPIAMSIKKEADYVANSDVILTNIPGEGVAAKDGKKVILCGNAKLLSRYGVKFEETNKVGTCVYVAINSEYLGVIIIKDEVKEEAYDAINYLSKEGIKTIMLSGDNEEVAKDVADKLKLSEYHASLLPQDKVLKLDEILSSKKENELVVYVGDGINDAPVLARSDIGVSMGGVGSDAAIEASDIVLINDNLNSLLLTKKIAKKTITIVYENIIFAIGVKVAILILSIFGLAPIWLAIFGDVGVALLCVFNAMRSGKIK
ncbi:MAG: cadmium-translocating P-type ATPase [Bacilli bacterium]|nr:cadmium-translocating P-type ATPase [Bacilli bacterium]